MKTQKKIILIWIVLSIVAIGLILAMQSCEKPANEIEVQKTTHPPAPPSDTTGAIPIGGGG